MNICSKIRTRFHGYHSILRSYFFCFKYLPFEQAKKMPFFLDEPIDVLELEKGDIVLNGNVYPRMVWIGGGVELGQKRGLTLEVNKGGKLIVEGKAFFANGCYVRVGKGATMVLGDMFGANSNCFIYATKQISFGKAVLLGWDNEIIDSDGHDIWVNGAAVEKAQPIHIGNHVWITSHVKISKGVSIADECIVAKGAIVTKKHAVPHTLIGGIPAKDIRTGVNWKK